MLVDEEELSTVKVLQLDMVHICADAVGLASATVTVNGNSIEATITPKLVGSIFDLKSEKAPQEYGFVEIDLYRMDQVTTGIWLDPARSEDDRWIIQDQYAGHYPFAYLDEDNTEYYNLSSEYSDRALNGNTAVMPFWKTDIDEESINFKDINEFYLAFYEFYYAGI